MPSVYLETTIPSYLTAWPSRDLIAAAHQAMTRDWWRLRREQFELFISELVSSELSAGDTVAAQLRLDSVAGIPVLRVTGDVEWIADELVRLHFLPSKALADAFHIGFAAAYRIDYLLTWNCKHIANAECLPQIEVFLADNGFAVPKVCTPEELMGNVDTSEA